MLDSCAWNRATCDIFSSRALLVGGEATYRDFPVCRWNATKGRSLGGNVSPRRCLEATGVFHPELCEDVIELDLPGSLSRLSSGVLYFLNNNQPCIQSVPPVHRFVGREWTGHTHTRYRMCTDICVRGSALLQRNSSDGEGKTEGASRTRSARARVFEWERIAGILPGLAELLQRETK